MITSPRIEFPAEYTQQIENMREKGIAWRRANPERETLFMRNFAPGVLPIMSISAAIKNGFLKTNDSGVALLKAMHPWNDVKEPSLVMCLIALGISPVKTHADES